ncbi:tRNA uridine-5-carboxymethylaminomethyl(34) synthesis GTPase MnmE [Carboxydocella sp. ULO1]|uniref:tRNA uridine-5-carboxymethylaminomethyl(34) synthesis GTPase MnmE n=1 Tax=Carboxydocella sp. ULO1 TaxID=1926599 RepID=UPI0009C65057|nr:tRNA uridine-5-carboxymethylaminomethyl(34) synthesis GTPase MnmE [Carboxydocella sp. ULO1]GAW30219.1 tRNA modification GTPase [Carboxydocella sp. ULO1]
MVNLEDTIAAIATAPGEGGIGIIRVSGGEAKKIVDNLFVSPKGKKVIHMVPYQMLYGYIVDKTDGAMVDEVLVAFMQRPHSFTGEDVVEIHSHGGMVVLQKILGLVLKEGARLAEPGEFTKRAFINGRIDLSQAEAVIDLIRAQTDAAAKVAANQLQGKLKQHIMEIRQQLLQVLAYLEAEIDFPDEDIEHLTGVQLANRLTQIRERLNDLLARSRQGKILREGIRVVIAGKPNVGKSSLLNALLRDRRAIVTDIPGTTRDVIEEVLNLGGVPVRLVDTAGIRETKDLVEQLGVEKSKEWLEKADVVLFVINSATGFNIEDAEIARLLSSRHQVLLIINKQDLKPEYKGEDLPEELQHWPRVYTSLLQEEDTRKVEQALLDLIWQGKVVPSQELFLSNQRHISALEKAAGQLESALAAYQAGMPADYLSIDIRGAWETLGEISGETVGEDLLDLIFSQFCIGK